MCLSKIQKMTYKKELQKRNYKSYFAEKPDVSEVWFLSFISLKPGVEADLSEDLVKETFDPKIHNIEHLQIPLYDVEILTEKNVISFEFLNMDKKAQRLFKSKKFYRIIASCTTDAFIEWAGDWSDMGDYRLVYIFQDAKVSKTDSTTKISTQVIYEKDGKFYKNFDKQVTIPDREVWFKDE